MERIGGFTPGERLEFGFGEEVDVGVNNWIVSRLHDSEGAGFASMLFGLIAG